jgi:hypothetical protein
MISLLAPVLVKFLKSKLKNRIKEHTPTVGGTIDIKGIAHGISIEGMEFEADAILRRTK